MEQTARTNINGWQMAGAIPRTASVGTWDFGLVPDVAARKSSVATPRRSRPATRPAITKLRLARIAPAVVAVAAVSSLIGGAAVARHGQGTSISATPSYPMNVAVTVQDGDSLWNIAKRYGNPDTYILDRVDEIASVNDMAASTALYPGQKIWVPAHNADEQAHIAARRIVQ